MTTFAVILPAAGKSSRFKDQYYKKVFALLGGRPVWMHSAEKFVSREDVVQTLLVISPEDREHFHEKYGANAALLGVEVVDGGSQRSDSVRNALTRVRDDVDFVAVHDAARPCICGEWIDKVFDAAKKSEAAMFAIPVTGTLKKVDANRNIRETVSRDNLWEAQTPQVFRRALLVEAYAKHGNEPATDDAQLIERLGRPVTVVQGSPINMKITTKEDLRLAEHALKALPKPKLTGPGNPFAGDDMWR